MPTASSTRPRRLGLSLRVAMLLVLAVGAVLAWEVRCVRTQQAAVALILEQRGQVLYDDQFDLNVERHWPISRTHEPAAPVWLRRWLGDDLFRTVAAVDLQDNWLDEADEARAVGSLDRLQSLTLSGWPNLNPALLAEATRSPRLRRLHLRGLAEGRQGHDGSVPAILATVGGIASLREVLIDEFYGDGAELAELARLPNLKELRIGSGAGLTDQGLARGLAALGPSLRSIRLAGGAITMGTMSGPESATQILAALATHHPRLTHLDLREIPLGAADYAAIGRLVHLRSLSLNPIRSTPTAFGGFASAPATRPDAGPGDSATDGAVTEPQPSDEAMRSLAALGELTDLTLFDPNLTDEGLRHLAPLRRLRQLRIDSPRITDGALATVRGFADLESLALLSARVSDARLADLAGLTRLRFLTLGAGVTDAGVPALARRLTLESLGLRGTALTDASLGSLAALPRLTMLVLARSGVTPGAVARLQATRPDLTVQATIGGKFRVFLAPNQARANAARAAARGATSRPGVP